MSKLEEMYQALCRRHSDINLHLPTLRDLVYECNDNPGTEGPRVTEMGTRHGWSSVALIMGEPMSFISYDIDPKGSDHQAICAAAEDHFGAGEIEIEFRCENTLSCEIEETDILFIDTLHTGAQLSAELARHHKQVRSFIAMHDLVSFGLQDEAPTGFHQRDYHPGLIPAVMDFLVENKEWRVYYWSPLNNGLLILKKEAKHG
jgi:hypothetical protein